MQFPFSHLFLLKYRISLPGFFNVVSSYYDRPSVVDTLTDKMIPNTVMKNVQIYAMLF
jgi:hypothetical protein